MLMQKKKLDYKWVIFACCFVMSFVCLGFCSGNKGLYLTAITEALSIKRSVLSINDSFRYAATCVINLLFGAVIGKFGMRKTVAVGFIALIASSLIYATAESVWLFCVAGALLGVGMAFATTTVAGSLIRRWFHKDIGRYTGIVFAANGIGTAVAAQIVSPMINEPGNPFGYRTSYFVISGILLVTGVLVVAFLRERPAVEVSAGIQKKKSRGVSWNGIDYQVLKRRPFFYLAAVCVMLTGFILQGVTGVYAAHMKDVGLKAEFVASIVGIFALALTGTKILVGELYDRWGLQKVMYLCQGATVVAFAALAFVGNSPAGMGLSIAFAILYALALPLETLVVPLIVNDLFGYVSYDKLLGIMSAANYTGYALGAPIVNLCYDIYGSYQPILLVCGALMIPIAIVFRSVIRQANKERDCITEE